MRSCSPFHAGTPAIPPSESSLRPRQVCGRGCYQAYPFEHYQRQKSSRSKTLGSTPIMGWFSCRLSLASSVTCLESSEYLLVFLVYAVSLGQAPPRLLCSSARWPLRRHSSVGHLYRYWFACRRSLGIVDSCVRRFFSIHMARQHIELWCPECRYLIRSLGTQPTTNSESPSK